MVMTHAHKHTHTQRVHTQSSQELQREAMVAHAANAKFETELKERMSQLGASRDEEVRLRGLLQQLQVCICVFAFVPVYRRCSEVDCLLYLAHAF